MIGLKNLDMACTFHMPDLDNPSTMMAKSKIYGLRVYEDEEGAIVACLTDEQGTTVCSDMNDLNED